MSAVTLKDFAQKIGRSYSGIRDNAARNDVAAVGTVKVAPKSYAFLYNESDLQQLTLRARNGKAKQSPNA